MEMNEATGEVRLVSGRAWRERAKALEAAMQAFDQALRGPWSGYPGRVHTERYYTVSAEAVEAFKRALEPA